MACDLATLEWWQLTDPCQESVHEAEPGGWPPWNQSFSWSDLPSRPDE